MLPFDHDGPHVPTPHDEIWIEVVTEQRPLRPNVTPINQPAIGVLPIVTLCVLSVPWWVGVWQIVRWIWR